MARPSNSRRRGKPPPALAPAPAFRVWMPILIVLAGAIVYLNALPNGFIFDDMRTVVLNEKIRTFDDLLDRRPVVNFLMAVNYAIGGVDPLGYHALNVVVHLLAGLVLFGLVRRTLRLEHLRERFEGRGDWIALAVAVLWVVHPLNTQAVTYVTQRGESIMGLFYLLSLYTLNRLATARTKTAAAAWAVAIVGCLGLGMGSKAVMVTAPIAMILYDWIFLARGLKTLVRRRWWLYGFLLATGVVVLVVTGVAMGVLDPSRDGSVTAGFSLQSITPLEYAASQLGVVLRYLCLVFWPHPLVLDYWWPVARTADAIAFAAIVIGGLLLATAGLLWRRPTLGFVALMVFLILAPTSTIVPIQDIANEHRMYLSTAAVLVLLVLAAAWALDRMGGARGWSPARRWWTGAAAVVVVAAALGARTVVRNFDYRDHGTIWRSVLAKRPHNPRAFAQVGNDYAARGMHREAIAHYTEALLIDPGLWKARSNLGQLLLGYDVDAAVQLFRDAVTMRPNFFEAQTNLGDALVRKGEVEEALVHLRRATKLAPGSPIGHNNFGRGLYAAGRYAEAERAFRDAIALDPEPSVAATAYRNLGNALNAQGRSPAAIEAWATSFALAPDASVANNIGGLHLREGRRGEAVEHLVAALGLDPTYDKAVNNLAIALAQSDDPDALASPHRHVPGVNRAWARAYEIIGDERRRNGRLDDARAAYARALRIHPEQAYARRALELIDREIRDRPGG